jgi:hypothetical protein
MRLLLREAASNADITAEASSKEEVKMENNEYVGTCALIRKKEHSILSLKTWVAPEIMCYLPLGNSTLHLRVRRLVACHMARSHSKL